MKNIRRILVDMDDVLVDFVGGALQIHGIPPNERRNRLPAGVWDTTTGLGMSPTQFMRPIDAAGEGFWRELASLPWKEELLSWIEATANEWYISTNPGHFEAAYVGKAHWLHREFGADFDRFIFTSQKHLLATRGSLLIDDNPSNVARFREEGGNAILFPTWGNQLYHLSDDATWYMHTLHCMLASFIFV